MGRNACVFVGEQMKRREEEVWSEEGGVWAGAAAWLCVWMKELLSLSHFLLLSVSGTYFSSKWAHVQSKHSETFQGRLQAGGKHSAETLPEGASLRFLRAFYQFCVCVFFTPFWGENCLASRKDPPCEDICVGFWDFINSFVLLRDRVTRSGIVCISPGSSKVGSSTENLGIRKSGSVCIYSQTHCVCFGNLAILQAGVMLGQCFDAIKWVHLFLLRFLMKLALSLPPDQCWWRCDMSI